MAHRRKYFIGAGLLGILLLGIVVAFAWLSRAEINASWLRSTVAERISSAVPGLQVSLGDIRAQRIPWRNTVRVTVSQSTLRYHEDVTGKISRIVIELDGTSLLRAEPKLKTVAIYDVDGTARWRLHDVLASLEAPSEGIPTLPWLDGLQSFEAEGVHIRLAEADSKVEHSFTLSEGRIRHHAADLLLSGQARLSGPEGEAFLKFEGAARPHGPWRMEASLEGSSVTGLTGPLVPALAKNRVDLPMHIQASVRADSHINVAADIAVSQGTVSVPELWRNPLGITAAKSRLVWNGQAKVLHADDVSVNLDGVQLSGFAHWPLEAGKERQAAARLTHVSAADLHRLWPIGAAEGGRRWVERNVTEGFLPQADFRFMQSSAGKRNFALSFSYDDLTVFYRRPMPPVVRGSGNAKLMGNVLQFNIAKAEINGLAMDGSVVQLTNLGLSGEQAVVSAVGNGPIVNLLEVLDSEPLGYISAFGLKPSDVSGTMRMTGTLSVPLRSNVTFDDVQFNGRAQGKAVGLPDVMDTHDLSKGDISVAVDREGLVAEGTADIGPQPVDLVWRESFSLRKGPPSTYIISAHTDAERLQRLGYGIGDLVEGPLDLKLNLIGRGQTIERGIVSASLKNSTIDMRNLGIRKPAGVPGEAGFSLRRVQGRYVLDNVTVTTPRFTATGRGLIDPANGSRHWMLDRVKTPYYQVRADILDVDNRPMRLSIEGETLNLKPILEQVLSPAPAGAVTSPPANTPWPDLVGSGRFQRVQLFNDQVIEGASLSFETRDNLLSAMKFSGMLDGKSAVAANISTQGAMRQFSLDAANAGRLARALDIYTNGDDGTLHVDAKVKGTGRTLEFDGVARMKNFRIAEAPILAKMLTVASLTGLRDTLVGRGILFENAKVPFKLRNGVVTVSDGRIIGPALGITINGQFQQSLRKAHFKGVLVPSYTINSLIGKIPLLGRLVVGGKHQGLLGFNYRIEGEMRDPAIHINPVSFLTPGFLRLLLSGGAAKVPEEPQ